MEKEPLSIMIVKTLLAVIIFAGMWIIIIGGAWLIGKQGKVKAPVIWELGVIVDGHFKRVSNIELPISETEAKTIVKEFCEPENQDNAYGYDTIKEADNEWRIPITNLNCPCYATVNIETGETNCMKEIPFGIEKQITIATDKTEYEQGEMVKITVRNNLNEPIYYMAGLSYCESKSYNTYQFSPEKEKWIDIFTYAPICAEFVGAGLPIYKELAPSGSMEFIWNQMIWNSTGNNIQTLSGKYKNSIKYKKSKEAKNLETIYSNEFTIKEKSAFDPRCDEKVKGVGPCEIEHMGYEFDQNKKICIKRNVTGCSFETPFNSSKECQEVCEEKDMSCEQATDCIEKCPKCVDKSQLRTNCAPRFKCVNGTCECECVCLSM